MVPPLPVEELNARSDSLKFCSAALMSVYLLLLKMPVFAVKWQFPVQTTSMLSHADASVLHLTGT